MSSVMNALAFQDEKCSALIVSEPGLAAFLLRVFPITYLMFSITFLLTYINALK